MFKIKLIKLKYRLYILKLNLNQFLFLLYASKLFILYIKKNLLVCKYTCHESPLHQICKIIWPIDRKVCWSKIFISKACSTSIMLTRGTQLLPWPRNYHSKFLVLSLYIIRKTVMNWFNWKVWARKLKELEFFNF